MKRNTTVNIAGGILSGPPTPGLCVLTLQDEPMGAIAAPLLIDKVEGSSQCDYRAGLLSVALTGRNSATKQKSSHHI